LNKKEVLETFKDLLAEAKKNGIDNADINFKRKDKSDEFTISLRRKIGFMEKHGMEIAWLVAVLILAVAIVKECMDLKNQHSSCDCTKKSVSRCVKTEKTTVVECQGCAK